ncbi:MAG: sugar phosphate isomerase/epimerase [Thaumarchaeota archaeon]|nr:sugar phosphate isomerase/epimerase [Nitrososphaerota archaeon]
MIKTALFTVTYCGLWYKGDALPLKEQIRKARELGFEGITVETKRPVALPCDLDLPVRKEVVELACSHDIRIAAVETMSNFVSPIIEERENNLCMVKESIRLAADLNTNIVKVFAAWPGTSRYDDMGTYDFGYRLFDFKSMFATRDKMWRWAVQGIRGAAKWAGDYGIVIALQNHPPVIRLGYEDALQMVREAGMDNVKLCLDAPLLTDQSDKYIREAVDSCKEIGIVLSHYSSSSFDESPSGEIIMKRSQLIGDQYVNYPTFIRELKRIGYDGFLSSEECSPVLENHEYQGIEVVDRHVKAALKYVKKLIADGMEPKVVKR